MEIERKFLVKQLTNLWEFENKVIEQFYINMEPEIRIRRSDEYYSLTIKSEGNLERQEVEIAISQEEFGKLKEIDTLNFISKTRYFIPNENHVYELDVYHNVQGLFTVEVEFKSREEARNFVIPDWFGDEITNIQEFKNKNLAQHGFPRKLTCFECNGEGYWHDRDSMCIHSCDICKRTGKLNIKDINLDSYNRYLTK